VLERFNRKERNILIRDALGHEQNHLRLSGHFRERVRNSVGLAEPIPEDAWWATDYHINWLAGGLAIYMNGWPLPHSIPNSGLIEGNQEDVDLIIAAGEQVLLIEAKAYGAWGRRQIQSKLERFELLHSFYTTLEHGSTRRVRFRLLLLSPRRPQKLNLHCPSWLREGAVDSEIPWMELRAAEAPHSILEVTRCDEDGNRAAKGGFWRCVECGSSKPSGAKS
jgi:hypothetical protein